MKVNRKESRKNEKGAAMVMVLLISLLLLTASAGLLMESSMNTQNVSDATAEQQAYNAAESGLQATINVLRGNSEYQKTTGEMINFRKAVTVSTSNSDFDSASFARLSRWLDYNYSSEGNLNKDRVKLGSGTDYLYNVTVTDPDNTGQIVSFTTNAQFYDSATENWVSSLTLGTSPNLTLTYDGVSDSGNLDVSGGSASTNFGTFRFNTTTATSVTLPEDLRFRINVTMTAPYNSIRVIRGWIRSVNTTTIEFDFDSALYDVRGSLFTINNDPMTLSLGSQSVINGTVGPAEPYRVVVRSVGYGPRGARKELEATVQKNFFNGLSAPATLTLIGPPSSTNGSFHFKPGTSNNVTYSGDDISSSLNIPSIGTTNQANLDSITDELSANNVKTVPSPPAENVLTEVPFWLESPTNLHNTINDLRTVAKASGKYFTNGQAPNNFGHVSSATGITFVDGDVSFSGNGGGILVCTGKLTLKGNFSFNGLIIVTGAEGVQRNGGGNGTLRGNTVIAPYNPANLNAGFLAPKYDISGGGNSTIRYDSNSLANGMTAVSNFVLGVAEK
jgi:hypothetical protein